MKDKRIWVIIGCILVVGIAVTSYTSSVVKTPQESGIQVLSEDTQEKAVGAAAPLQRTEAQEPEISKKAVKEAEEKASLQEEPETETREDADRKKSSQLSQEEDRSKKAEASETAEEEPVLSEDERVAETQTETFSGSAEEEKEKTAVLSESAEQESYTERLKNLDSQIQKMREQETDSNVYSVKTSAETELKMWDGELSVVYNALLEALPQEEALSLANEEKDWLKKRESDAADSSGKTGNSLSYASSMASQTRERAYELAKRCDELAEKN